MTNAINNSYQTLKQLISKSQYEFLREFEKSSTINPVSYFSYFGLIIEIRIW